MESLFCCSCGTLQDKKGLFERDFCHDHKSNYHLCGVYQSQSQNKHRTAQSSWKTCPWNIFSYLRFRSIAKSYFRRADGVLLLYDVTCEKSFLNVREWVDMIEVTHQLKSPVLKTCLEQCKYLLAKVKSINFL